MHRKSIWKQVKSGLGFVDFTKRTSGVEFWFSKAIWIYVSCKANFRWYPSSNPRFGSNYLTLLNGIDFLFHFCSIPWTTRLLTEITWSLAFSESEKSWSKISNAPPSSVVHKNICTDSRERGSHKLVRINDNCNKDNELFCVFIRACLFNAVERKTNYGRKNCTFVADSGKINFSFSNKLHESVFTELPTR